MTKDLKTQLDTDIVRFLENIETQSHLDRIQTLKLLFDKYLHLNSCDFLMDYHDLINIINGAKNKFSNESIPIHLGAKKRLVSQNELTHLFLIESAVSHFNMNGCLKKTPKFDKREDKF